MPGMRMLSRVVTFVEISIAAVAMASVAPAFASPSEEPRHLTDEQIDQIEQRFAEIRERLNLSEEQRTAMEPILRRNFEKRAEILEKYGVSRDNDGRPGFRQMRAMRNEMDEARQEADDELSRILDDEQMKEYREIQEENRQLMRERIRQRR